MEDSCSCSILYNLTGKHCEETGKYLKSLVKFLQKHMKVQFSTLVADFTKYFILPIVRDEDDNWYFLSVKAFKLWNKMPLVMTMFMETEFSKNPTQSQIIGSKIILEKEYYERVLACKLCQVLFPPDRLPHKLTMKMLVQAEKQIKVRRKQRVAPRSEGGLAAAGRICGV
eukprot:TRINITY_DN8938_c0_g1_i6.p2 TRINITY_DN8938_c0_g1~~TRINITY_DN8938_c0_g1_i6.p2  ORF type:complete len:170 (-),score=37.86 TRINITY_DN8938_c0_g1_i6:1040-1549(-)